MPISSRLLVCAALLVVGALQAQSTGSLSGHIRLRQTGDPLHRANVLIVELGRSALSSDDGSYRIDDVPPGRYQVVAHLDSLFTQAAKEVVVSAGGAATADFELGLQEQKYEVNVTASGEEQTAFESFSSVKSLDAYDLSFTRDVSLGEALDQQVGTGIAKRSFGPGSSRPIIRGFDGDRVLIMEDGIRTGTLSAQSGDHGEVVNTAMLERIEVVKGPATLLYSGNAIGGTVNAVSRHHEMHRHPHEGLRGYLSGSGGTANSLGGGSAGFEYGKGKWMLWGSAAGTRSGDYTAPQVGQIFNSRAETVNGGGGVGWFGDKTYLSFDFKVDDGVYGVPFAQNLHAHGHEDDHGDEDHDDESEDHDHEEEELERVSLDTRRKSYRVNWGLTNLPGFVDNFALKLSYTDWEHDEVEYFEDGHSAIGTAFRNDQFVYRGEFTQRQHGVLSGRFGFWGIHREYDATGEEALSPPVDQDGLAFFALEEIGFERVKFQFGGRVETQLYDPAFPERALGRGHEEDHEHEEEGEDHDEEPAPAVRRRFTGGSAAAGVHVDLWTNGAFVANYAHSYRAPALEELYNLGPHVGNLAFEIGNPQLDAERGNGFDLSLRHQEGRIRGELNYFYYDFSSFIFPFATGEEIDNLRVIEFTQRDARYTGVEASAGFGLHRTLWLNLGLDLVDAEDTEFNTPLPRIPPLRGKIGLDFNWKGFRAAPELILAADQNDVFTGETPTAGYAVVNLKAAYTYATQHAAHQFSVNVFNVGDRLYRNHSSLIKDLAPEIGRGVRFTYMMRFF